MQTKTPHTYQHTHIPHTHTTHTYQHTTHTHTYHTHIYTHIYTHTTHKSPFLTYQEMALLWRQAHSCTAPQCSSSCTLPPHWSSRDRTRATHTHSHCRHSWKKWAWSSRLPAGWWSRGPDSGWGWKGRFGRTRGWGEIPHMHSSSRWRRWWWWCWSPERSGDPRRGGGGRDGCDTYPVGVTGRLWC